VVPCGSPEGTWALGRAPPADSQTAVALTWRGAHPTDRPNHADARPSMCVQEHLSSSYGPLALTFAQLPADWRSHGGSMPAEGEGHTLVGDVSLVRVSFTLSLSLSLSLTEPGESEGWASGDGRGARGWRRARWDRREVGRRHAVHLPHWRGSRHRLARRRRSHDVLRGGAVHSMGRLRRDALPCALAVPSHDVSKWRCLSRACTHLLWDV